MIAIAKMKDVKPSSYFTIMKASIVALIVCSSFPLLALGADRDESTVVSEVPSLEPVSESVDKSSYLSLLYTGFPATQKPLEEPPLNDYLIHREEYTAMLQYFLSSNEARSHHIRMDMKHNIIFVWQDTSKSIKPRTPCLQVFNFQFLRLMTFGQDALHENREDSEMATDASREWTHLLDNFQEIEDVLITDSYDDQKLIRFVIVGRSRPKSLVELQTAPTALVPARTKQDTVLLTHYPLTRESIVPLIYIQKLEDLRLDVFPIHIFHPAEGEMRLVHANAIQTTVKEWTLSAHSFDAHHLTQYYPPIQDPILPSVFYFYSKANPTELNVIHFNSADGKMRTSHIISIHPNDGMPLTHFEPDDPISSTMQPRKILPYDDPTLLDSLFAKPPLNLLREDMTVNSLNLPKNGPDPAKIVPRCLLFIYATCVRAVVFDIARIIDSNEKMDAYWQGETRKKLYSAPVWSRTISDLAASSPDFEFTFHSPYSDASLRIAHGSTHLGLVSINRQGALNAHPQETASRSGHALPKTPPQSTIQFHCLYLRNLFEQAWHVEDPFYKKPPPPLHGPPVGLQVATCPVPLEDWQDELTALLAMHTQYTEPVSSSSSPIVAQHGSESVGHKTVHIFMSEKLTVQQFAMVRIALQSLAEYKANLRRVREEIAQLQESEPKPISISDRVPVSMRKYVQVIESNANTFGVFLSTLLIVIHGLSRFQYLRVLKNKLMDKILPAPTLLSNTI